MKIDVLKEYTKNDNLDQYIKLVKSITDIIDDSFWFQDIIIKYKFTFCFILLLYNIIEKQK